MSVAEQKPKARYQFGRFKSIRRKKYSSATVNPSAHTESLLGPAGAGSPRT